MRPAQDFLQAVPPFIGCKRRLCPLIFALLNEVFQFEKWRGATLLDAFTGSGAVGLYGKALGFDVLASDVAERGIVTAKALIANSSVRLSRDDALSLFVPAPLESSLLAGTNNVRKTFSNVQEAWIGGALAAAGRRAESTRALLQLLVIKTVLRMFPMSLPNATDAGAMVMGDVDVISSRRLAHYVKACDLLTLERVWEFAQVINQGVFGGRGVVICTDALTALRTTSADVTYLDPPYAGTAGYNGKYSPIDRLLGDDRADHAPVPTLDDLMDAARAVPIVVLSYGGPTTTLDELATLVGRHRRVELSVAVPYPHLRPLTSEVTNGTNDEFIIVARRR